MIRRNCKLGKQTIPVLAELGTGDVAIISHKSDNDEKIPYVLISFTNGDGGLCDIGKPLEINDGTTSDDLEEIPMALKFTNPKSIDSLINQLLKSRAVLAEAIDKFNLID